MEDFEITLGKIIRDFRYKKGFTQKDLAKKAGISVSAIQQIEYGKLRPKIETLLKIFNILGLDCDIWDGDGSYSSTYSEEYKQTLYQSASLKSHKRYHLYINLDLDSIDLEDVETRNKWFDESFYKPFNSLISNFNAVNEEGQQKIVEYSNDIAENPKYKKGDD